MSQSERAKPFEPSKPGPEAETLKIEGNWEEAVKQALKKGKPSTPKKRSKKKATTKKGRRK